MYTLALQYGRLSTTTKPNIKNILEYFWSQKMTARIKTNVRKINNEEKRIDTYIFLPTKNSTA